MNEKDITTIIEFVQSTMGGIDLFNTEAMKALGQLEHDGEAMRTPIAPETLRADGWNADPEGTWSYRVDLLEWVLIERRGDAWELITAAGVYPLPGVETMHDLRELVRLIGGSQ